MVIFLVGAAVEIEVVIAGFFSIVDVVIVVVVVIGVVVVVVVMVIVVVVVVIVELVVVVVVLLFLVVVIVVEDVVLVTFDVADRGEVVEVFFILLFSSSRLIATGFFELRIFEFVCFTGFES